MKNLYIDWLCFKYSVIFSRRHLRYAWIAFLVFIASFPHWFERRLLRTGYCFLQAVDDVLDGDMDVDGEPLDTINSVVHAIETRNFGDEQLMVLAKAFTEDVEKNLDESYLKKTLALIEVMKLDRKRILNESVLSYEELNVHHFATFSMSLDLLLAAIKSEIQSSDVVELVLALGWCSTVRDLKDDLATGIINVPREVLEKTSLSTPPFSEKSLTTQPSVMTWLIEERSQALENLDVLDLKLKKFKGRHGYSILKLFSSSVRGVANKRFFKLYPQLRDISY